MFFKIISKNFAYLFHFCKFHRLLSKNSSSGFEKPSSIQQRGIVAVNTGRHVIAQAQSGTGKTGTFCIGTLNRIDLSKKKCQILVLFFNNRKIDSLQFLVQNNRNKRNFRSWHRRGSLPTKYTTSTTTSAST